MYKHNVNNSMLMGKTVLGDTVFFLWANLDSYLGGPERLDSRVRPIFKGGKIVLVFIAGDS